MTMPVRRALSALACTLLLGACAGTTTSVAPSAASPADAPSTAPTLATTTPSVAATPTATPFPLDAPSDVAVTPGTYRFTRNGGGTTFVLPEGWAVPTLGNLDFSLRPTGLGTDDAVIVFFDMRIASRDAACSEALEPGIGASAADIVGALAADPALTTTKPQPVTIGGLHGLLIDTQLAPDWTRDCPFTPGAPGRPILVDDVPGAGPFWGIGRSERERVIVLDHPAAQNVTLLIDSIDGTTFDPLVDRAMPVLESLDFDQTPLPSPIAG